MKFDWSRVFFKTKMQVFHSVMGTSLPGITTCTVKVKVEIFWLQIVSPDHFIVYGLVQIAK